MAGFVPDEGEALIADMVMKRVLTDRDADLEIGLFTNVSPGETISEATLTEPTGGGYARKDLTDASWTGSADSRAYAEQSFTATGEDMTGSIQGYFIATKSAGGTPRIIAIEVDASGPYTLTEGDTYNVTPNIAVA